MKATVRALVVVGAHCGEPTHVSTCRLGGRTVLGAVCRFAIVLQGCILGIQNGSAVGWKGASNFDGLLWRSIIRSRGGVDCFGTFLVVCVLCFELFALTCVSDPRCLCLMYLLCCCFSRPRYRLDWTNSNKQINK